MPQATIRLQTLGAQWETLGTDRLRGIVPENIEASSNDWGPEGLSFTMRADAGARRPDLNPFTPIELEVGGVLVWAGFIWQRPSAATGYAVVCRGWQYHLDDDRMDRAYVHTRLADYIDDRSTLTANLVIADQAGQVQNDGTINLGYANGQTFTAGHGPSVTLDLGPDSVLKRVVVVASTSFNTANLQMFVIAHDSPWWGSDPGIPSRDDLVTAQVINAAPWTVRDQQQTFAATVAGGRSHRYLTFLLWATGTATPAADCYLRIHSCKVFRETAYESGNASILKSSDVIKDALAFAPLLNPSVAEVSAGTFSIPSYLTDGYLTPRDVMQSVNVLENYRLKIGGGDLRSLVYGAKPSAPLFEVGDWSGAEFSDASMTGEPIYNKAIVDAKGPEGARVVAVRGASTILPLLLTDQSVTNLNPATGPVQMGVFSKNVALGFNVPYLITFQGGTLVPNPGPTTWRIRIGNNATENLGLPLDDYVEFVVVSAGTSVPAAAPLVWRPTRPYTKLIREDFLTSGTLTSYTAVAHKLEGGGSLIDRRSFGRAARLDVGSAVTSAVAARIADLYLTEHLTAPFSGSLRVTGPGARRVIGGATVPPHEFLLQAGEKIRLSNRVDPDTGAWGRDGRIAGATYRHNEAAVEIAIDDQRKKFETILARYAALVGG